MKKLIYSLALLCLLAVGFAGAQYTPLSGGTIMLLVGKVFGWNGDTGLSRDSADTVDCGNGTTGDKTCTLNVGSLSTSGASQVAGNFSLTNLMAATSSLNGSSPPLFFNSNYWNGSASVFDQTTLKVIAGVGTNPTETLTVAHVGSSGAFSVAFPALTVGSSPVCTIATGCGISSSSLVTFVPGTGVTSATCITATCSNRGGEFTLVGGTGTTGTIVTLNWTSTGTAYICTATQNGGATLFGLGNSVATASSMNVTAAVSIVGSTFNINYSCTPN